MFRFHYSRYPYFEIVLGIDKILLFSELADKLPEHQQKSSLGVFRLSHDYSFTFENLAVKGSPCGLMLFG